MSQEPLNNPAGPPDANERSAAYDLINKRKPKDVLVELWVRLGQTIAILGNACKSMGLGMDGLPLSEGGIPWPTDADDVFDPTITPEG